MVHLSTLREVVFIWKYSFLGQLAVQNLVKCNFNP